MGLDPVCLVSPEAVEDGMINVGVGVRPAKHLEKDVSITPKCLLPLIFLESTWDYRCFCTVLFQIRCSFP